MKTESADLYELHRILIERSDDPNIVAQVAIELEGIARRAELAEMKDSVAALKKRYETYGERYSWRQERWEPDEEVTVVPELAEVIEPPDLNEELELEIEWLQTLVVDLRRENVRLHGELEEMKVRR